MSAGYEEEMRLRNKYVGWELVHLFLATVCKDVKNSFGIFCIPY